MTAYVITRQQVGYHKEGAVVEISDEDEAAGVDVERLLRRGGLRPASPEEAEAARPIRKPSSRHNPGTPPVPRVPPSAGIPTTGGHREKKDPFAEEAGEAPAGAEGEESAGETEEAPAADKPKASGKTAQA